MEFKLSSRLQQTITIMSPKQCFIQDNVLNIINLLHNIETKSIQQTAPNMFPILQYNKRRDKTKLTPNNVR